MSRTIPNSGMDVSGIAKRTTIRGVFLPGIITVVSAATLFSALTRWGGSPNPTIYGTIAVVFGLLTGALLVQSDRNRRLRAASADANLDALTGILNRGALMGRITQIFAARERTGQDVGIFFIDVDRFKQVNDRHGHDFGDQYLRHIAWQISAHVREADLVGRMGGDEFVAILPGIDRDLMRSIAERLVQSIREPFTHRGTTIQGGLCIGCHLSPAGEGPTSALDLADGAAYQAKMLGRGRVVEFTSALAKARERRDRIVTAITGAVEDGDFDIHYQPVFAVADGHLTGFEALLRLSMPGGTALDPAEVLPIAESTGLIIPLGTEILRRTAKLAAQWQGDQRLSVNISPVQFRAGNLPAIVFNILDEANVDHDRLILEVTERIVTEGGEEVAEQLAELRAAGVAIVMDDFGGGAASLGHLWTHRFDEIKVDGALQEAYVFDPFRYRPLLDVIVDLGRRLRMPVTLKGVENALQAGLAQELGCAGYQGTWLARPMPAEKTLHLTGGALRPGMGGPPTDGSR